MPIREFTVNRTFTQWAGEHGQDRRDGRTIEHGPGRPSPAIVLAPPCLVIMETLVADGSAIAIQTV